MFERFTEEARQVVVAAQDEAREARDPFIDCAHLLVGVAAAGGPGAAALRAAGVDAARLRQAVRDVGDPLAEPLDADALAALGIDLGKVRQAVESVFGSGALNQPAGARRLRRRPTGHLPFTGHAKKALELSLRAAVRRNDGSIDSRHLLLGVLGAGEVRTAEVLRRLEVDAGDLRTRLEGDSDAA
jgi:ATP-dependent Clp protease ATP-binding subunit ClpA